MKFSSGETAIATTDDNAVAVSLLDKAGNAITTSVGCTRLFIINEGANPGFYSVNSGPWCRLPAASSVTIDQPIPGPTLRVKRVSGGGDLASVFAWGY
jgi:hypothetical protein